MGYFDSLAESSFKENPEGEGWLYYPNGILSKGRIVKNTLYKEKLFKFQKRMYMVFLPSGVLYGLSIDTASFNLYSLLFPLFIIAVTFLRQYWLTKDLPISKIKLKYKEATTKAVKGLPSWYLYLLFISSVLVIIFGLFSPLIFNKPYSETVFLTTSFLGMGITGMVLGFLVLKYKKN
jgi:hypothetical protein